MGIEVGYCDYPTSKFLILFFSIHFCKEGDANGTREFCIWRSICPIH